MTDDSTQINTVLTINYSNSYLLDHIVIGAGFRGSGGGGPVDASRILAKKIKDELDQDHSKSVSWVDPFDIPDGEMVATMSSCGSPESITQNPDTLNFNTWCNAWKQIDTLTRNEYGKPLQYVAPVEIGAWNCMAAIIIALEFPGVLIVDGDGAGRAVPVYELSRVSYISCNPTVIANGEDNYDNAIKVGLFVSEVQVMQSLAQAILQSNGFDNIGALSIWAAEASAYKDYLIPHTMTEFILPAAEVMIAAIQTQNPMAYMLENMPGSRLIIKGLVTEKKTSTENTLDLLHITVEGENRFGEHIVGVVYGQNENMYGFTSDLELPAIVGPDCICWATKQQPKEDPSSSTIYSVQPLDNSNITVGMELWAIGFLTNSITAHDAIMNQRWKENLKSLGYSGQHRSGLFAEPVPPIIHD